MCLWFQFGPLWGIHYRFCKLVRARAWSHRSQMQTLPHVRDLSCRVDHLAPLSSRYSFCIRLVFLCTFLWFLHLTQCWQSFLQPFCYSCYQLSGGLTQLTRKLICWFATTRAPHLLIFASLSANPLLLSIGLSKGSQFCWARPCFGSIELMRSLKTYNFCRLTDLSGWVGVSWGLDLGIWLLNLINIGIGIRQSSVRAFA